MAMIRANELENIFCDLQNAVVDIKEMEIFNYASTYKNIFKNITKTAVVYKTGRHDMQELTLFTRTANTRGFKVKLFNNIPDALRWLKFY